MNEEQKKSEALINLGDKIKTILIELAVNDELPMDMTQLDPAVFNPCIEPLVDTLICVQVDAEMALRGDWDRSDDGFEAQIQLIDSVL